MSTKSVTSKPTRPTKAAAAKPRIEKVTPSAPTPSRRRESAGRDSADEIGRNLIEMQSIVSAISVSMAVIEFDLDGTVLTANDNFLHALGYTLSEIQGKHHSMFVDDMTRPRWT